MVIRDSEWRGASGAEIGADVAASMAAGEAVVLFSELRMTPNPGAFLKEVGRVICAGETEVVKLSKGVPSSLHTERPYDADPPLICGFVNLGKKDTYITLGYDSLVAMLAEDNPRLLKELKVPMAFVSDDQLQQTTAPVIDPVTRNLRFQRRYATGERRPWATTFREWLDEKKRQQPPGLEQFALGKSSAFFARNGHVLIGRRHSGSDGQVHQLNVPAPTRSGETE